MKKHLFIFGLLLFFGTALGASAFDLPFGNPDGQVDPTTITDNHTGAGGDEGTKIISGSILTLVDYGRKIVGTIVILWIVWQGIVMVTAAGEDDKIEKAKRGITWGLIGISALFLVEPFITNVLYGGGKVDPGDVLRDRQTIENSIAEGTREILGVLDWIKALLVTVAMAFIILSGWKMVQSMGDQEEISKQKKVILWIAVGFIIIAVNEVIINEVVYKTMLGDDLKVLYTQNPARGISEAVGVIKYILGFLAVIALAIFVYGGFLMITAFTNEENAEKGKKILIDGAIGIFIILISYALVSTLLSGQG